MSVKDEEDKAPSYIYHDKFYKQLKAYYPDPAKRCLMYDMITEYGLYGTEPDNFESLADKIFFDNSKEFIDYDMKKRAASREAKSKAGSHNNHKNQYMDKGKDEEKESPPDNGEEFRGEPYEEIPNKEDNTLKEEDNTSPIGEEVLSPVEDTSNMEENTQKVEQMEQSGTDGTERNKWNVYAYAYAYVSLYEYAYALLKQAGKQYSLELFKKEIPLLEATGLSEKDLIQTLKNLTLCSESPECFENYKFTSFTNFFKTKKDFYESFYPGNFDIGNHLKGEFLKDKDKIIKKYSPKPIEKPMTEYEKIIRKLEYNPICPDCGHSMAVSPDFMDKFFRCKNCKQDLRVSKDCQWIKTPYMPLDEPLHLDMSKYDEPIEQQIM